MTTVSVSIESDPIEHTSLTLLNILMEIAKVNRLEPWVYLKDLFGCVRYSDFSELKNPMDSPMQLKRAAYGGDH